MGVLTPKKKLFGANIEPACEYCELGTPGSTDNLVLCEHKGVVAPYYSCRRFTYAPLKRVPKRSRRLPAYTAEDFKL